MALLSLEALGRKNVAGPLLLLLNLVLYVSMLGFASWALNSFVDGGIGDQQQGEYYHPPAADDACTCTGTAPRSAGDEATLHFIQFALLAAVLGTAAKAAAAFHARASWRPQGLAAVTALGTVAWAATALALGLACKEMRAAARGWQMRALEAVTAVLTVTQLAYVLMLHRAAAADADEAQVDADADADAPAGEQCDGEPGCSTGATEGDDDGDCQHAQQQQQHGRHQHHHHRQQGGGPSCGVM